MQIIEAHRWIEAELKKVSPQWYTEARLSMCFVLNCEPITLVLEKHQLLTEEQWSKLEEIVVQRKSFMPLQYILGVQSFLGHEFEVNKSVLIPRQETEVLVEYLNQYLFKMHSDETVNVLDIGTGSGVIAITIALNNAKVEVVGSDLSKEALEVAARNADKLGVSNRIRWIQSDLFVEIKQTNFDVIVSNPPYIPLGDQVSLQKEIHLHEPHMALFGGEDGLDLYKKMIPEAMMHLNDGGMLIFEAGHNQADAIEKLLIESGYNDVGHFEDLNGIPRFIYGKKGFFGG